MIEKNLKKFKQNKIQFNDIFKLQLQDYFFPIPGFDKMKFEDYLRGTFKSFRKSVSMIKIVEKKYGTEAKDLILNLIKKD